MHTGRHYFPSRSYPNMKPLKFPYGAICLCLALSALSGCGSSEPHDKKSNLKNNSIAKVDPTAPSDTKKQTVTDASQVLLGDATLTAGIPGDGQLTALQIDAWLDHADNHVPLDVVLPLGLAKAQGEIKGLKANPLTRAKVELGRQLFFDTRLSSDNTVSCSTCHRPEHGFAAPTRTGVGVDNQTGPVNTPVAFNRIFSELQFWDGRAGSLEEQAIGPIANPIEM
ncbi:MAG: cytochrome-c peroxidase, partial [Planctomycetales bacterium]